MGFILPNPITNAALVMDGSVGSSHAANPGDDVAEDEATVATGDPPATGRVQEEANSAEHALTSEPKIPYCQFCMFAQAIHRQHVNTTSVREPLRLVT